MPRIAAGSRIALRDYPNSVKPTAGVAQTMSGTPVPAPGTSPSITIEGWFFVPSGATTNGYVSLINPASGLGFALYGSGGDDLNVRVQNGASFVGVTLSSSFFSGFRNTWIHLAFVLDGVANVVRVYRDGAMVVTSGALGSVNFNSAGYQTAIGVINGLTNGTPGIQAVDLNFYARALSTQDVSDRYLTGRLDAAMQSQWIAGYLFSEGNGSATAADRSGNGRTLNLASSADWSTLSPMRARGTCASAQNLIASSTNIAAAISGSSNIDVSTGLQADPFGGTTATLAKDTAVLGPHFFTLPAPTPGAAFHTFSIFGKAGTKRWLLLAVDGSTLGAWFDLQNGVLGTVQAGVSASIIPVAGAPGWYRCSATISGVSKNQSATAWMVNADNSGSYLGDGTGNFFLCSPQYEDASSAGAYLPTPGAAQTSPRRNVAAARSAA